MNYIKIQNNYINLNQISYFKVDPRDYYIAFYSRDDNVLVISFDYRDEYNEALEKLKLAIREKGSLTR